MGNKTLAKKYKIYLADNISTKQLRQLKTDMIEMPKVNQKRGKR